MRRFLILILFFYILALLQTSFLVHFNIFEALPLILIFVLLLNIFENPAQKDGILTAVAGGFFLDIFSENFVGFHILILLCLSLFIKFILKRYVCFPVVKRF